MDNFLSISIIGVLLSLIIEGVQRRWGTSSNVTKSIALLLSMVIGLVYVYLNKTSAFETVLGVLAAASTVYAFFFKAK